VPVCGNGFGSVGAVEQQHDVARVEVDELGGNLGVAMEGKKNCEWNQEKRK